MALVLGQRLPVVGKAAFAAAALAASVAIPSQAAETAQVTIELAPAERAAEVVKVQALDRTLEQKLVAKQVAIRAVDAKPVEGSPGQWRINGLTPGEYDLYVETKSGKFEGYALPVGKESDEPLPAEAREKIATYVRELKDFHDQKRVLAVAGNGKKASALVELIRTGPTSNKPGEVIWRVERWSFEKVDTTWQRENGGHRVLRRFQIDSQKEFAGWNWNFVPELGGLDIKAGDKRTVNWTIPAKFDAARGRAAGREPDAPRGPPPAAENGK